MEKVIVEGRIMYVECGDGGDASPGGDAPHSHYCLARKDQHVELGAFRELCKIYINPSKARSILELFGGSGWHSAAIQDLIKPESHEVLDLSSDCVASIRASLPEVSANVVDSHTHIRARSKQVDWVHADFNQFTWSRHLKNKNYQGVLDGIFRCAKHYATITDSAIFGLLRFAQNRRAYSKDFGISVESWDDYCHELGRVCRSQYGFGVRCIIYWSGKASMFLLEGGYDGECVTMKHTKSASVEVVE